MIKGMEEEQAKTEVEQARGELGAGFPHVSRLTTESAGHLWSGDSWGLLHHTGKTGEHAKDAPI